MTSKEIMSRDDQYVLHTYGRSKLALVSGHGITAVDAEGNEYMDCTAGIGVNGLGFCDEGWVAAVTAQLQTLQHTSNLYYTAPCGELAEILCTRTGMDKVFFSNSGAEANEGAIKAARKYSRDKYGDKRSKVLTLTNSFHGRTLATLIATGQEEFHHSFGPFPTEFAYIPAEDMDALKAACADGTVCALMMEIVQGEGGVKAMSKDYMAQVVEFCHANDILIIADEVQSGVGRTGTLFAFQQYDFLPDIVTMAKCLGGGLPLGGFMMQQKVADVMTPGSHGSTFGGNPVATAGAVYILNRLDDAFLAHVQQVSAYLREKLAALPHVQEVTGLGLMVGLTLGDGLTSGAVRAELEKAGLLVLTAHAQLRLLPPLIFTEADADRCVAIMQSVLEKL